MFNSYKGDGLYRASIGGLSSKANRPGRGANAKQLLKTLRFAVNAVKRCKNCDL